MDVPDSNLIVIMGRVWGTAYSYAEYRGWLEEAGFHNIIQLSERRLKADR
jgi:hypothetical protein